MDRMDGCCNRASAFASWRKRASMPGVHAISGWSTLHASRRSRSLSHSSYTSANPPRPTRRRTSYLEPSARARRWAVGTPASPAAGTVVVLPTSPLSGTERGTGGEDILTTVGDGVPQLGQNAEQVEVTMEDGTRLVGWYLASTILHQPPQPAAGLLWFYGNGETIAAIWP